jgi:hypothetical protein
MRLSSFSCCTSQRSQIMPCSALVSAAGKPWKMNKIAFTRLQDEHDTEAFQSGVEPLDNWLRRTAKQHIARGISRTFVAVDIEHPAKVLGCYALTVGEAVSDAWPMAMVKKVPRKLPIVLLGRLACDKKLRGQGLGDCSFTTRFNASCAFPPKSESRRSSSMPRTRKPRRSTSTSASFRSRISRCAWRCPWPPPRPMCRSPERRAVWPGGGTHHAIRHGELVLEASRAITARRTVARAPSTG